MLILFGILAVLTIGFIVAKKTNLYPIYQFGQKIDNFNGVRVYYNGSVGTVKGRALTKDGYNLGLKYQCVEFVKRYYFEALNHKMPDSYGHAKDFFVSTLKDGQVNKQRNLIQYTNASKTKPKVNDLVVYSSTTLNSYGHVAIISQVSKRDIEIVQQNPGPYGNSRATYKLIHKNGTWQIKNNQIMGWLRKR